MAARSCEVISCRPLHFKKLLHAVGDWWEKTSCTRGPSADPGHVGRWSYGGAMLKNLEHDIGKKFGRLTVVALIHNGPPWKTKLKCQCECGSVRVFGRWYVLHGRTLSCGCLKKEKCAEAASKQGLAVARTPEYRAWYGIKSRCLNQRCKSWDNYGGRGIKVCERWAKSFAAFLDDVGPRPSSKHSIGRINNDGHYEPGNVRWETIQQQNVNKRPRRWFRKPVQR
jgi:hypothetical protein